MKVLLAIPARYGSSRFEGKPLVQIQGMSMIERVYRRCLMVHKLTTHHIDVVVATDDDRIFNHVKAFGGEVMMTSLSHQSGTDRVAEVASNSPVRYDVIINVQGDEPLIHPEQILQLIRCFERPDTRIATLIKPTVYEESLLSPNAIKCVVDIHFKALYFSRFPIPFHRNPDTKEGKIFYRHVGMYGFTPDTLQALTRLAPSALEMAESLEQLRWLENGWEIQTDCTSFENVSIDSPDDLEWLLKHHQAEL